MADTKINKQKYLWNLVPFNNSSKAAIKETNIDNINTYKMFPAGVDIKDQAEYYDLLSKFESPQTNVLVINYNWTTSPIEARADIPYIILKEKQIWKNNTIGKLLYNLDANIELASDLLDNGLDKIKGLYNTFADEIPSVVTPESVDSNNTNISNNNPNSTTDNTNTNNTNTDNTENNTDENKKEEPSMVSKIFDKTIETAKTGINKAKDIYDSVANSDLLSFINKCKKIANLKGPLNAYEGLYYCLNSGFKYILPYFNNSMRQIDNTFTMDAGGTQAMLWETAASALHKISQVAGGIQMMLDPNIKGFYIEQPKPFQYPQNGSTLNIKFPLINTGDWSEVIANWQFVFLLLYQNQPTRNDKMIIVPPAIYEVEIPCVRYIPYAYIKSLNIEYLGTRRTMDMPILRNNKPEIIRTIIPDSWMINITLEGLTSEPTNFNILNNNIITTDKK